MRKLSVFNFCQTWQVFEVLGWPNEGPKQNPLERAVTEKTREDLKHLEQVEVADDLTPRQILLVLLAVLVWFCFLGMLSWVVINWDFSRRRD